MHKIDHLKRNEIDSKKWDVAIDNSNTQLPYAYSWYLDAVSPNWEALVAGDYQAVMALPVKHKYGFKYVIQPRFVQQLGVFASKEVTAELVERFLKAIPYLCYDFNLNYSNCGDYKALPNATIDLNRDYNTLRKSYNKNCIRNLNKATSQKDQIVEILENEFIEFWQRIHAESAAELLQKLPLVCEALSAHSMSRYLGVRSEDGELIAALLLVVCKNRLIYLAPASSHLGKERVAMFVLIDSIIKTYSGETYCLDFEGSRIPGVMRLYKGFGGKDQPYYRVRRGRPDWLVQIMHR